MYTYMSECLFNSAKSAIGKKDICVCCRGGRFGVLRFFSISVYLEPFVCCCFIVQSQKKTVRLM